MLVRERVLASRLIKKICNNESYAKQIGLSYNTLSVGTNRINKKTTEQKSEERMISEENNL